jgi:hypothetical protein
MRTFMKVSLTAAFALGILGLHAAQAADVPFPQGQAEAPPQAYGPPPEQSYAYPPPPVAYGYPPPAVFYAPPPYVVVPGPYFVRGPYWSGYASRYALAMATGDTVGAGKNTVRKENAAPPERAA